MTDLIDAPVEAPAQPAKTPKDLLRNAALIIEEFGWAQGVGKDGNGRHCAIGAIYEAGGAYTNDDVFTDNVESVLEAVRILSSEIRRSGWSEVGVDGIVGIDVATYNDNIATEPEQITGLMRSAADRLP